MAFELPPLPYGKDALVPHMSPETFDYHYAKHHQAYVNNLNKLVAGTDNESKSLEEIIMSSSGGLFNNAAQVWNHTFFWNCLSPSGGGLPHGELATAIDRDFGSFSAFRDKFAATAAGQFGSGWGWLVMKDGKLDVMATSNADLPMKHGATALFTVDVWEHAYYVDYRNDRAKFIASVISSLANWDFVAANLKKAG
jgi:Fe-Mn family superoxide dismutase